MKADFSLIRKLTHGAVIVKEENGEIFFSRFTEEQQSVYQKEKSRSIRMHASSGIRLDFQTDARVFSFSGRIVPGSSRNFYWFDIAVNGVLLRHEGAESRMEQPDFSYEIPLEPGLKQVSVYFPGLTGVILQNLEFSGETFVLPVAMKRTILCYGDSITQGYDARYASLAYPSQLADALEAEMFNKAIGGEIFNPEIASLPDPVRPDLITAAYGTNDWSTCSRSDFQKNMTGFFHNLTRIYPDTPVFALLPIWRIHCETLQTEVGTFAELYGMMRRIGAEHPQIRVLDGLTLVPHLPECFSPDGLHPNDFGFLFMGRNLVRQISAVIG